MNIDDINKQAYLVMSNINSVKVLTNIKEEHFETLMQSFLNLQNMFNEFILEGDNIKLTTPTGKIVYILSEEKYISAYRNTPRPGLPQPNDYNNWSYFLLSDKSIYTTLTEEDRVYIFEQQYKQYSVWKHLSEKH